MKYPEYIYECVRENWGIGDSNTECDHEIDSLDKKEVLQHYLTVNHGIKHTDVLFDVIKDIYGVDLDIL